MKGSCSGNKVTLCFQHQSPLQKQSCSLETPAVRSTRTSIRNCRFDYVPPVRKGARVGVVVSNAALRLLAVKLHRISGQIRSALM